MLKSIHNPWLRRGLIVLAVLLVAAAGVGGFLYWQANQIIGQLQQGPKKPIVQAVKAQLDQQKETNLTSLKNPTTFLLIGSDERPAEKNGRSDTMMLVRIDPTNNTASILSLPRDLLVDIPGYGQGKLNAAYTYGGPALLTQTIKGYLGIPINHYAQVDFKGFSRIIQRLGGIYLPIDQRYYHVNDGQLQNNYSSIDIHPGYQKLSSEDALAWVRFRHGDSDFYRAARQQIFLREAGRQLKEKRSDIGGLPGLLDIAAAASTSDIDSVSLALKVANTVRSIPSDRINRTTIEASDATIAGGSYLVASPAQKQAALSNWKNPSKKITLQKPPKAKQAHQKAKATMNTVSTASYMNRVTSMKTCSPSVLPTGYQYPAVDALHQYQLAKKPAAALYATKGSGKSLLWMWTTWTDAPILASPTKTQTIGGTSYDLFYESGKLRMIAWRIGSTRAWLTNTLKNDLSATQIIALARSCKSS